MDEQHAIQRTKQGDPSALTWLVERYQLKALRTAYLITCDHSHAEDAVQDVFLDLPELLRSFDARRPLEPWLMRVVVNRTLRLLARDKHLIHLPDARESEEWTAQWTDDVSTPESAVQQRELEDELWQQMQKLSAEQRAALVARYYLQMSEAEMASLADVPAGTIKWRLSKARARLRQLFGDDPRKEMK
jgi:RNA polymerase sigma-70 factor (ECF subfamily)